MVRGRYCYLETVGEPMNQLQHTTQRKAKGNEKGFPQDLEMFYSSIRIGKLRKNHFRTYKALKLVELFVDCILAAIITLAIIIIDYCT